MNFVNNKTDKIEQSNIKPNEVRKNNDNNK